MAEIGADTIEELRTAIAACTVCAWVLPAGPRPVVRFSDTSKVLIIGKAPSSKVHASGIPWADASGDRLRQWLGIDALTFYDPGKIALVGMGFCYPGKGKSGDLPPRRECAPLWHERIFAVLPPDRLTLLVGAYAQAFYLPKSRPRTLAEVVRAFDRFGPAVIPLPHPAWRVALWMKMNPCFETDVLPALRAAIRDRLPA
jgi:uracil-DNA glycosylase